MGKLVVTLFLGIALTCSGFAQEVKLFTGPDQSYVCPDVDPIDCPVHSVLFLTGMNNKGQLSGYWFREGGGDPRVQSVLANQATGVLTDIPVPKGLKSGFVWANKVNEAGQVIGYELSYAADGSSTLLAVLGNQKRLNTFQLPGTLGTLGVSLNDLGDTAGTYIAKDSSIHGFYRHAKERKPREIAFPGAAGTLVSDINNAGDVIGTFGYANSLGVSGFLLHDGIYSELNFPGAAFTYPMGMNNLGDIVGSYLLDGEYNYHGFTFSHDVFVAVDLGTRTELEDINDSGVIVGHGENIVTNSEWMNVGSFVILPPPTAPLTQISSQ